MATLAPLVLGADALDAVRAYLRIEQDEEDPLLLSLTAAALRHCEGFLNTALIARAATERLFVSSSWQRLSETPVRSITQVTGIPAEGAGFVLSPTSYALDIDASGDGWVRVTQPGSAGRIDVTYQTGVATTWAELPEAISLAVIRLAAHLYTHRDSAGDQGPPAAVAALLRPWRRMRLS